MPTKLDALFAWARKNSLWPFPFRKACCAIEFMIVVSSRHDISRFGAEAVVLLQSLWYLRVLLKA